MTGHCGVRLLRLAAACIASLSIYVICFALLLDRPLSFGFLRQEMAAKLTQGASIAGPKLVILAGSNGPYSHRCATIGPLLHLPCVNAGVAVGIGLDYQFARWQPLLHAGDVVYLPMEETQYTQDRLSAALGPDAAIMLRHDWSTLAQLRPHRWIAALFAYDLRGAVMALVETMFAAAGLRDHRAEEDNALGDHIGHTALLAAAHRATLDAAHPYHVTADEIRAGYGSRLISQFASWARVHGVCVIGGLPTGFADSPITADAVTAIRQIYVAHGGLFLELPNRSRYPRMSFFDTPDHLNETWQKIHSAALARALGPLLTPPSALNRASFGGMPVPHCGAAPTAPAPLPTR